MLQVTLSIGLSCPWMTFLSRKYGGDITLLDCKPRPASNGTSALAKICAASGTPERITHDLQERGLVKDAVFHTIKPGVFFGIVTTKGCPCGSTIMPSYHLVSATAESTERLRWTLLVGENEGLKELVKSLEKRGVDFRIKKVAKVKPTWPTTRRQEEVLRIALALGFYEVPRKIGLKELAKIFGISPRGLSEILRRGERKVIAHLMGGSPSIESNADEGQEQVQYGKTLKEMILSE